ncbi:quinone-dependent dihydroorotate dehydrogenase [Pseudobdellovibrio exovorus]|uniref:Dihydroorotate dehydrogenase (quinone) n=1 Tax=Pseudobdellovibrio exovorus JSS TaxID=1184267 RepID=M4VP38_9BACT|nr:quinone-dependent dihydroorotate dehydrogenase [Pseudobdellovibrio exovorus]AGH94894.1 dihydroorotate dehydrogenase 2 [Pseudobdellovibrio exovorus JSS]
MLKPWLWLPPKTSHDLAPLAAELFSLFHSKKTPIWNPFTWQGISFQNRLGLAGGVDKNADHLRAWEKLGCGFVEVGTVTPLPQEPNAGRILDRSIVDQALWNKMGFPSAGADEVFYSLRSFKEDSKLPVFVNIGKNRDTPNELASQDYSFLLERFHTLADAFVVNISSPNTKGLRDLANQQVLEAFLKPIYQKKLALECKTPLLLKLSPDLERDELRRILDIAVENQIDGFVMTNTTLSRQTKQTFPSEGGLSGKPVSLLSKLSLQTTIEHLGSEKSKKLVISVGGVMTAEDVFERISLGADLVEVYTALVFSGLNFFRKVEKQANATRKTGNSTSSKL